MTNTMETTNTTKTRPVGDIEDYHAHVYFDENSREPAQALRDAIAADFPDVKIGRWWEKLVGPHPRWSYQTAFGPDLFGTYIPWLVLNRRGLTVFIHTNTGENLADHTGHTMWLGEMPTLNLDVFLKDGQ